MFRLKLLLFVGLLGLPLAVVPFVPTQRVEATPDLTGRWRVQTVLFNGKPSERHEFNELVFTDRTVEYVSPAPAFADTREVS